MDFLRKYVAALTSQREAEIAETGILANVDVLSTMRLWIFSYLSPGKKETCKIPLSVCH